MKKLLPAFLLTAACGAGLVDHDGFALPPNGSGLHCSETQLDCGTGVCVNPDSDVNNCGACGNLCATPQHATSKCEASVCGFTCNPGFFPCGAQNETCCPASSIAAGGDTSCAVVDTNVECWGSNDSGQLGFSPVGAPFSAKPVKVPGVSAASSVAVGGHHACAIVAGSGQVRCWGANDFGQLGAAGSGMVTVPGVAGALLLALGDRHSCAVTGAGTFCWGANDFGQLGHGPIGGTAGPTAIAGFAFNSISAGTGFTCGIGSGATYCWGDGSKGQFGDGNADAPSATPVAIGGLSNIAAVAAGTSHACAIGSSTFGWGNDDFGQASGDGRPATLSPVKGISGAQSPLMVAAGIEHSCVVSGTRDVVCWGGNGFAQLGLGVTSGVQKPVAVPGLAGVQALTVGARHTCAQTADNAVYCWGANLSGQAAAPASTVVVSPRPID
jgi:alpha-tubulin suppressor-like RCC1 family protein